MGTKNNPSAWDCYANAHPDEPMFVLLGRDQDAPDLVDAWADDRERAGEDPAKVAEARGIAEDMRRWRTLLKMQRALAQRQTDGVTRVVLALLQDRLDANGPLLVSRVDERLVIFADGSIPICRDWQNPPNWSPQLRRAAFCAGDVVEWDSVADVMRVLPAATLVAADQFIALRDWTGPEHATASPSRITP